LGGRRRRGEETCNLTVIKSVREAVACSTPERTCQCLLLGHFKKKKKEILRVIFLHWKASAVGGEVVAPAGRG